MPAIPVPDTPMPSKCRAVGPRPPRHATAQKCGAVTPPMPTVRVACASIRSEERAVGSGPSSSTIAISGGLVASPLATVGVAPTSRCLGHRAGSPRPPLHAKAGPARPVASPVPGAVRLAAALLAAEHSVLPRPARLAPCPGPAQAANTRPLRALSLRPPTALVIPGAAASTQGRAVSTRPAHMAPAGPRRHIALPVPTLCVAPTASCIEP